MGKKIILGVLMILLSLIAVSCQGNDGEEAKTDDLEFKVITSEEAKKMMDTKEDILILDVRTEEEYKEGHLKGAVLIPVTELAERATAELADKNQTILVYCRSGNRSRQASELLVDLGYTNIFDMGGLNAWNYEVEK